MEIKYKEAAAKKAKYSGTLLELRKKEQTLVKQGQYEEAQKVKFKADSLQAKERVKLDADINESVMKRLAQIKKAHELEYGVMLKRIQRDRNDHLKERARNSQRFLQRNKNQLHDLLIKQGQESKRVEGELRKLLFNLKMEGKSEQQKARLSQTGSPIKPANAKY
jgi:hypothetical protein